MVITRVISELYVEKIEKETFKYMVRSIAVTALNILPARLAGCFYFRAPDANSTRRGLSGGCYLQRCV